jgi:DNA-directed RNA polymerase specialized sigma24 family protein
MPQARKQHRREFDDDQVEAMLRGIAAGDRSAREWFFAQYRPRLARLVQARRAKRSARALANASDIVQKAMAVAARRLDDYIARRPMPVLPWLYDLTRDQLGKAHKKQRANVSIALPDESADRIADILLESGTTPVATPCETNSAEGCTKLTRN